MSDQQPDLWGGLADVMEAVTWGRMSVADLDAFIAEARAEESRRHAEELEAERCLRLSCEDMAQSEIERLKAAHAEQLARWERSYAEKLRSEMEECERAEKAEAERDTLRAQLAAVQQDYEEAREWVRVGMVTLQSNAFRPSSHIAEETAAQLHVYLCGRPLTLKEPTDV